VNGGAGLAQVKKARRGGARSHLEAPRADSGSIVEHPGRGPTRVSISPIRILMTAAPTAEIASRADAAAKHTEAVLARAARGSRDRRAALTLAPRRGWHRARDGTESRFDRLGAFTWRLRASRPASLIALLDASLLCA